MFENFFQCPYCWEDISMLLDTSLTHSSYIEDCEVCCRPIQITTAFENSNLTTFSAENIEQ